MFIPVCFILFYAIANRNSKFYFSGCSLQVYKNTILCIHHVSCNPAECMCSKRFLVDSSGFFIYQILSSASKGSFTSFFPIWISHIYLLAYLAQPEPPMQCRIGVARAVILVVPPLSREASNLSLLRLMPTAGSSLMPWIRLRKFPPISSLLSSLIPFAASSPSPG